LQRGAVRRSRVQHGALVLPGRRSFAKKRCYCRAMAIKFRAKTKQEIPAELQSLYMERDGSFVLDVEGVVDKARVGAKGRGQVQRRGQDRDVFRGAPPQIQVGDLQPRVATEDGGPSQPLGCRTSASPLTQSLWHWGTPQGFRRRGRRRGDEESDGLIYTTSLVAPGALTRRNYCV